MLLVLLVVSDILAVLLQLNLLIMQERLVLLLVRVLHMTNVAAVMTRAVLLLEEERE
jgi:hypothetical protein